MITDRRALCNKALKIFKIRAYLETHNLGLLVAPMNGPLTCCVFLLFSVQYFLWKENFWSKSYCLISAGGASLEVLKEYIEKQGMD